MMAKAGTLPILFRAWDRQLAVLPRQPAGLTNEVLRLRCFKLKVRIDARVKIRKWTMRLCPLKILMLQYSLNVGGLSLVSNGHHLDTTIYITLLFCLISDSHTGIVFQSDSYSLLLIYIGRY